MTTAAELIIARFSPCRCGCRGRDPQHRATYRRAVRNVRREPRALRHAFEILSGRQVVAVDRGEASLPGRGTVGVERQIVQDRDGRLITMLWTLSAD